MRTLWSLTQLTVSSSAARTQGSRRPRHCAGRAVILGVALFFVSCKVDNPSESWPDGDEDLFVEEVQPAIAAHCGFVGCHGREGVSLTLYSVDYLRMRDPDGLVDPSTPALDERTLSPAEIAHNREAIAARATPTDPDGRRFIDRLVDPADGGIPHGETVVFETSTDPDLDAFRRFLAGVRGD